MYRFQETWLSLLSFSFFPLKTRPLGVKIVLSQQRDPHSKTFRQDLDLYL